MAASLRSPLAVQAWWQPCWLGVACSRVCWPCRACCGQRACRPACLMLPWQLRTAGSCGARLSYGESCAAGSSCRASGSTCCSGCCVGGSCSTAGTEPPTLPQPAVEAAAAAAAAACGSSVDRCSSLCRSCCCCPQPPGFTAQPCCCMQPWPHPGRQPAWQRSWFAATLQMRRCGSFFAARLLAAAAVPCSTNWCKLSLMQLHCPLRQSRQRHSALLTCARSSGTAAAGERRCKQPLLPAGLPRHLLRCPAFHMCCWPCCVAGRCGCLSLSGHRLLGFCSDVNKANRR